MRIQKVDGVITITLDESKDSEQFKDLYVEAHMSLIMDNPLSSFSIDVL